MKFDYRFFAPTLLVLTALPLHSQDNLDPNKLGPDTMVRDYIAGERDCNKEDLQFLIEARKSGAIKTESLPFENCKAVSLTWLPTAKIVKVEGVIFRDVLVSITAIQANEQSHIVTVKALGGMVEGKERENNDENKAAFNQLLSVSKYKPNDDQLMEISALYLFMVGHPPDETPKKAANLLMTSDIEYTLNNEKKLITVSVHQRKFTFYGMPFTQWKLTFHTHKDYLELVSVLPD